MEELDHALQKILRVFFVSSKMTTFVEANVRVPRKVGIFSKNHEFLNVPIFIITMYCIWGEFPAKIHAKDPGIQIFLEYMQTNPGAPRRAKTKGFC